MRAAGSDRLPDVNDARAVAETLLTASRVLVAITARSLVRVGDEEISISQFRVLVILEAAGSMRPVDLADALEISRSSTTRLCDRLAYKGLITRTPHADDRRGVQIELTVSGRRLVRAVSKRRLAEIERIVERIPPRKRGSLIEALVVFAEAAGEAPAQVWDSDRGL